MGKFSKMLYMIDLLNTGNKYLVRELAEKLGVSERMVRYYKEELENNGIFIESFKGPNGGYFLIDSTKYYINFNKYDIKLLEYSYELLKNAGFEFENKYSQLLEKAKNMKSIAEEKSKFISSINIKEENVICELLHEIILKNEKIDISYQDIDGEVVSRTIHPLQFFKYKDSNYVTAYCELRKDIRHFEIDRMKIVVGNKKD